MWGRPAVAPPARFDRPISPNHAVAARAGGHCRPEGDRRSPLRGTSTSPQSVALSTLRACNFELPAWRRGLQPRCGAIGA
jgi:hypothetical protein